MKCISNTKKEEEKKQQTEMHNFLLFQTAQKKTNQETLALRMRGL
jgi:hypothetical protein